MQNKYLRQKLSITDSKLAENLSAVFHITSDFANLLVSRGIKTVDEAQVYLYPDAKNLTSPFVIPNMQLCLDRIHDGIKQNKHFLIYGDYDCDGICAVCILYSYLLSQNAKASFFIPNRSTNGYGLSTGAIDEIMKKKPDVVITVDCGITSKVEVEYLTSKGVEVIVTDHHEVQDCCPDTTIVNAKLSEDNPLKDICGAGLAFMIVAALSSFENAMKYVDLAGIATIADIVPLIGDNRIIAALGIKALNNSSNTGLKLLAKNIGIEKITSNDIAFRIAPRLNSAGRLDDCANVVRLLLSNEYFEIGSIIEELNILNFKRQELCKSITDKAIEMIKGMDIEGLPIIILHHSDWEIGVLGIAAARIAERYNRPTLLFADCEGKIRGSCRSVSGINLYDCLYASIDLFDSFGGHSQAAGLSMTLDKLDELKDRCTVYLNNKYSKEDFLPVFSYDILLDRSFSIDNCKQFELLEPTGVGNPKPKFIVNVNKDVPFNQIGNSQHAKARLNSDCEIICFNDLNILELSNMNCGLTLCVDCTIKNFRNNDYVQMLVSSYDVTDISQARDTDSIISSYVKHMLYGNYVVQYQSVCIEECLELYRKYDECTALVCFSVAMLKRFDKILQQKEYSTPAVQLFRLKDNPENTLIISPQNASDLSNYKRLVFLEAPLSFGVMAYLGKGKDLYLLKDSVADFSKLQSLKISQTEIKDFYYSLKYVYDNSSIPFTIEHLQNYFVNIKKTASKLQFNVYFYILFELKAIYYHEGNYKLNCITIQPQSSTIFNLLEKK